MNVNRGRERKLNLSDVKELKSPVKYGSAAMIKTGQMIVNKRKFVKQLSFNSSISRNQNNPDEQYKKLYSCFLNFPLKMLNYLIVRNNGNCYAVHRYLTSKGWTATTKRKEFTDQVDPHFSTDYYFGTNINESELETIFKSAEAGSFLTFYKYSSNQHGFTYFVCAKTKNNVNSSFVETLINGPTITEELKNMLELTKPVSCNKERDISWVPTTNSHV